MTHLLSKMEIQRLCFGLVFLFGIVDSDCPSNWKHIGNYCFFFSKDTEVWINAGTLCKRYQAYLAEIDSEDQNKFVTKFVADLNHDFWIGASDVHKEGEWAWYNSRQVIDNSSYSNWATNGLDDANGNENCAQIGPNGKWHDAQCDQSHYYICRRSTDHNGEIFG